MNEVQKKELWAMLAEHRPRTAEAPFSGDKLTDPHKAIAIALLELDRIATALEQMTP